MTILGRTGHPRRRYVRFNSSWILLSGNGQCPLCLPDQQRSNNGLLQPGSIFVIGMSAEVYPSNVHRSTDNLRHILYPVQRRSNHATLAKCLSSEQPRYLPLRSNLLTHEQGLSASWESRHCGCGHSSPLRLGSTRSTSTTKLTAR